VCASQMCTAEGVSPADAISTAGRGGAVETEAEADGPQTGAAERLCVACAELL
jgi:hypothetical protein